MVQKPLVSIRCMVYNHEPYLRQCLEGFVMQKTTFPFEAIVHDDASTDGSAAIIREYAEKYPDIIRPIYETDNQYSKRDGSIDRIMDAAIHPDAKYIALCEGDDYWIDPLKLQTQVDFLEKNLNYVLVHTAFRYKLKETFAESIKDSIRIENISSNDILFNILNNNYYRIQTCTVLFRRNAYDASQEKIALKPLFMMGDTPLWLHLLQCGNFYFMKNVTAIYRKDNISVTRPLKLVDELKFSLSCAEMRVFYSIDLKLPQEQQNLFIKAYINAFWRYKAFCHGTMPREELSFLISHERPEINLYMTKLLILGRKTLSFVYKYVIKNNFICLVRCVNEVFNRRFLL